MAVCTKIQDLLSPYLDGALSAEEHDMVERHLNNCTFCRQELLMLKETVQIMHSLPDVEIPADFSSRLHEKLVLAAQESKPQVPVPQKSWVEKIVHSPWFPLTAAAVLLIAIVTVINPVAFKAPLSDLSTPSEMSDSGINNEGMSDTIAMVKAENESLQKDMSGVSEQDSKKVPEKPSIGAGVSAPEVSEDAGTLAITRQEVPAVESVPKEKSGNGSQAARARDHKGDQQKIADSLDTPPASINSINGEVTEVAAEGVDTEITIKKAAITLGVKEKSPSEVFETISGSYQVQTLDEQQSVIIFKVPQEEMEKTISMLKGFGEIEQTSISNHDLSADYNETQNNLNKYLKYREELSALINASQDIEEKVRLEVKLHDLNSEIKLLEERILYYEEMSGSTLVEVTLRTVTSE
jgi:hypothetical protein